jgi:hypothetical protein
MSCGLCSKWQHIACHDRADQQAGRRRRNWDVVEFFCLQCRARRAGVAVSNAGDRSKGLGVNSGVSSSRLMRDDQSAMGIGASQLGQTPFLGHAYDGANGRPYNVINSNPYIGVESRSALHPAAMNGCSGSYAHQQQVSNVHSATSMPGPRHDRYVQHQAHPQQQQYSTTTAVAFSHYQQQQRRFSSPLQQQYSASRHAQLYGDLAAGTSSGQSEQYPMSNGSAQSHQVCYLRP